MPMWSEMVPNLQISWDAHSLKTLQFCPRRYQYEIIQGWRSTKEAVDLDFGLKFHDCLEIYERMKLKGHPLEEIKREVLTFAMILVENWNSDDSNKNPFTLIRSVIWYIDYWEEHNKYKTLEVIADQPAIERHFNIALPSWGGAFEDYSVVGYLDGVVQDSDGQYYIKEQKTSRKTLNAALVDTYRPDTQIELYSWAGQFLFPTKIAGILLDLVQTAVGFTTFFRATIEKHPENLEEFSQDLRFWIETGQNYAMDNYWPKSGRNCFMCPFKNICSAHPEAREIMLKGDFEKRFWDPTKPKETAYARAEKSKSDPVGVSEKSD